MTRTLTRIVSATVVSGIASLALAAPATAREIPDGGGPVNPTSGRTDVVDEGGTPWMEITLGALGGLALAGAGVAAAQSARHRHVAATP